MRSEKKRSKIICEMSTHKLQFIMNYIDIQYTHKYLYKHTRKKLLENYAHTQRKKKWKNTNKRE